MGSSRPLVTSWPSQSWAPTRMSGPWPAGAATFKVSRMSPKPISWTRTGMPYSASKVRARSRRTSERTSSAQIRRVPGVEARAGQAPRASRATSTRAAARRFIAASLLELLQPREGQPNRPPGAIQTFAQRGNSTRGWGLLPGEGGEAESSDGMTMSAWGGVGLPGKAGGVAGNDQPALGRLHFGRAEGPEHVVDIPVEDPGDLRGLEPIEEEIGQDQVVIVAPGPEAGPVVPVLAALGLTSLLGCHHRHASTVDRGSSQGSPSPQRMRTTLRRLLRGLLPVAALGSIVLGREAYSRWKGPGPEGFRARRGAP